MNKRLILILFLTLLSLVVIVSAISDDEAKRRNNDIIQGFQIKNGHVSQWNGPSGGDVTLELNRGWNLVPMFLAHSKRNKDTTCDEKIFENLWFYSPSSKSYKKFPANWYFLVTNDPSTVAEDQEVKNEVENKYYHIYLSSMWIYTPESCTVVGGDSSPVPQSIRDSLVLKAGWNFVYHDQLMYIYNTPLGSLLGKCGLSKVYHWNPNNQKWETVTDLERISVSTSQIFDTYLVKTDKDCTLFDVRDSERPSVPE